MEVDQESDYDPNTVLESTSGYASSDKLVKQVEELERKRFLMDRQWKLNLAFYKGKQYVFYNRKSRRIESLPTDDGDKPRYRVRLIANQIAPHTHSLLARLTKTKPTFFATPGQSSYEAIKATEVAESLLDYWWDRFDLASKREEAMLWAIICGNGFWKISWNDKVGSSIKTMKDPNGQPIVNPVIEHFYKQRLEQAGVDPKQFESETFEGEIQVDVMAPFDVLLDDSAQVFEDCKYAYCIHPMSPEEIKHHYGVSLKANAVNRYPDENLPGNGGGAEAKTADNVRTLYYGYFLPGGKYPEGRFVVFTKSPNIILYDAPWPYPFKMLPLVKFPGMRVPGQLWDTSVVENAIPMQKELNRTLSQMIEYKNLTLKPQMLAPVGSLRQRMTDEPGAIFEYNPVAGKVPEAIPIPGLPAYVFDHLQDLGVRLKDAFGLKEIMEGSVPPNVEAGIAIDLLQEAATDRLAPQVLMMEKTLEKAGNLMLPLAQQYYQEPRMIMIMGAGSKPKVDRFENAEILAGITVKVETGSGLPRTRAGKQARVMQMLQMGVITPTKAYKYLDMGDFRNLQAQFEADEEQAMREHDKLTEGQPINEAAAQEAQNQMMNMAMNPQMDPLTGAPQPPDQAQIQELMDAGLAPLPFENKTAHVDAHGSYMKSVEFESLPIDVKQRFYKHFELTSVALSQEDGPPGVAPKVSLQFRGAVGPTSASRILNQAGIRGVTPEEMMEPPLDTVVIDNKDKPNADDNAQGDQGGLDRLNKMQEAELTHQQKLRQQAEMSAANAGV